jgi:uncharacterized phosphosugar-binding protein
LLNERLARVRDTQDAAIGAPVTACADSIGKGKLVFILGSDHGAQPALETYPRTVTIMGFRPIVESTMISFHRVRRRHGAYRYRLIHAVEGDRPAILRSRRLDSEEAMILLSHFGLSTVIPDIATECKTRGLTVIAVTSPPYSCATPSRHWSGKRLVEVAEVTIDTGAPIADVALCIEGLDHAVGANSTSGPIAIAQAIVAATAEKLVARGVAPTIMVNPSIAGREAVNRQNDANQEASVSVSRDAERQARTARHRH